MNVSSTQLKSICVTSAVESQNTQQADSKSFTSELSGAKIKNTTQSTNTSFRAHLSAVATGLLCFSVKEDEDEEPLLPKLVNTRNLITKEEESEELTSSEIIDTSSLITKKVESKELTLPEVIDLGNSITKKDVKDVLDYYKMDLSEIPLSARPILTAVRKTPKI